SVPSSPFDPSLDRGGSSVSHAFPPPHSTAFERTSPVPAVSADASPSRLAGPPPAAAHLRPRGRGWSAAVASILEARAPKPGNVHPEAAFPDLAYPDLVAAGLAITQALESAATAPLGRTILDAVTAARGATRSNANLGIVLAIAPVAAVPDDATGDAPDRNRLPAAVADVLSRLTATDAADVWQAIGIASPGGMGSAARHDLAGPPPDDLLEAMRLAAPRDAIARLWAEGYQPLVDGLVTDLESRLGDGTPVPEAIVTAVLRQLAREPDSLIARRHGSDTAAEVSRRAAHVLAGSLPIDRFDRFLRAPRRLNPGTTADLTAAALYILLREGRLAADLPALLGQHPLASPPSPPLP
ncbi:MAG: triphosphoribosyl-dephospho-CoA synthase, partial [Planctomycetia bacterium]